MPGWVWWVAGLVGGLVLVVAGLPWLARPALRGLLAPRYRFRVLGLEHVPRSGPVVIASNHVSWIDGFLLVALTPRRVHALVNAVYIGWPIVRFLAHRSGMIPVPYKGPRALRSMIEAARTVLERGEAVLIFPEAQLTRNGLIGPFHRGLEVILDDRGAVPVVPVFLGNLWGSLWSYSGGRTIWKWPVGWRREVVVSYGPVLLGSPTAFDVRQGVLEASVPAVKLAGAGEPPIAFEAGWRHPALGLLTVSTPDFDRGGIHQTGTKPGTVGQAAPGVAVRAVDAMRWPLGPSEVGAIEAITPNSSGWVSTGRRGAVHRDGFVTLDPEAP